MQASSSRWSSIITCEPESNHCYISFSNPFCSDILVRFMARKDWEKRSVGRYQTSEGVRQTYQSQLHKYQATLTFLITKSRNRCDQERLSFENVSSFLNSFSLLQ
ncbi:hypothetical protein FGO68_gene13604 [Halteria grandinella]|uniref:Uncharacterized protein n=1 Tax=Halteria grandinella TaxID=5974 RepID=A0A8J8NM60_HALGN|nr:hypothetical protein FGO68_gene13604 [Halteria grandinella]